MVYPDFANVVSLTYNKYMLNDVYYAPNLKQIECGFCEEVRRRMWKIAKNTDKLQQQIQITFFKKKIEF